MAKALVYSDLHVHSHKGRTDRLHDCLEVLRWTFEEAEKNECKHILFLGDLFHERSKIDVLNYLRTFEVFMEYMLNKPLYDIYLLIGNHDMYHYERWDVNAVKPLSAIPGVNIVDAPQTLWLSGTPVDFLPHTENPVRELEALKKNRVKGEKNAIPLRLLLGHMAVHGAELNILYGTKADVIVEYDNRMVVVEPSIFDPWDMTLLGHYHGAQKLSEKAEYIGSPLQLSFGEAFQTKHIMVLDLETLEKKYIDNDFSPIHLIVTPQDIEHQNYDLKNNFVRVVANGPSTTQILKLRKEIGEQGCASLDFTVKERQKEEDQTVIEDAKAILLKEDEMLETYISEVNKDLDPKLLFLKGQEVCNETVF